MRYFLQLSYNGTRFHGWQHQPNAHSVQEALTTALKTILRTPIEITGCGRTDAGVHASQYYAHVEIPEPLPSKVLLGLNAVLPRDITVQHLHLVADDAHARFDATHRAYDYYITAYRDPFRQETTWHYPQISQISLDDLNAAAAILLEYQAFATFCKTNDSAYTKRCQITSSHWQTDGQTWVYHIAANRFLRGMVRLIVGMCLNVAHGRLTIEQVHNALANQQPLTPSLSVPPNGLFLSEVKYPFLQAK